MATDQYPRISTRRVELYSAVSSASATTDSIVMRRFVVWHSVPRGLETRAAVRGWLADALLEKASLVREYLPARPKAYPAGQLAAEAEALSEHLRVLDLEA